VSAPTHQGRHTDADLLEASHALAKELRPPSMNFTGIGELTTIPDWPKTVAPFLALPDTAKLLTTNLQKQLDDSEIETLARFDMLSISIDTANAKLLREIRRKSDLRNITTNLARLRAHCIQKSKRIPTLRFNVVMTDRSALTLFELAAYGMACGIDDMMLIELNDTEFFLDRSVVRHISALNDNEFAEFTFQLSETEKLFQRNGKQLILTGDLKAYIQTRHNKGSEYHLKDGETRRCALLWEYAVIKDDGRISHCCGNLMSKKSIRQHSFDAIMNDDEIRSWRLALLTGKNLPSACVNCHWAVATTPQTLLQDIAETAAKAHKHGMLRPNGAGMGDAAPPDRRADTAA
jgi:wyosine [tRNA(Phe)-imidazoG37] synthetase (radical SAM superfamily)